MYAAADVGNPLDVELRAPDACVRPNAAAAAPPT